MSKLIRKTTTVVEYLRAPQAEDDDIDREEGDLGEPEDEDDEDEAPRRRRASRRDG